MTISVVTNQVVGDRYGAAQQAEVDTEEFGS